VSESFGSRNHLQCCKDLKGGGVSAVYDFSDEKPAGPYSLCKRVNECIT